MADEQHYDVVTIGTGAGGRTLGFRLAGSGAKVLWLQRGDFLPRDRDDWDTQGCPSAATTSHRRSGTGTAATSDPRSTTTSAVDPFGVDVRTADGSAERIVVLEDCTLLTGSENRLSAMFHWTGTFAAGGRAERTITVRQTVDRTVAEQAGDGATGQVVPAFEKHGDAGTRPHRTRGDPW